MTRLVLIALPALALVTTACGSDTSAVTSLTGDPAVGKTLYTNNCAGCHGGDGLSGSTKRNIVSPAKSETDKVISIILDGEDEMPGFAATLTSQQIADIVAYVKTL